MIEALEKQLMEKQTLITEEEKNTVMTAWQQEMQIKKQAQMQQLGLTGKRRREQRL